MSILGEGKFSVREFAERWPDGLPIYPDGTEWVKFEADTIRGRLALLKALIFGKLRLYITPDGQCGVD